MSKSAGDGEQQKATRWESILRLSRGVICLRYPAGQLLCPHYVSWNSEDSAMEMYIPQGDGKIRTVENPERIVREALRSEHAELVNRKETPFSERDRDE